MIYEVSYSEYQRFFVDLFVIGSIWRKSNTFSLSKTHAIDIQINAEAAIASRSEAFLFGNVTLGFLSL